MKNELVKKQVSNYYANVLKAVYPDKEKTPEANNMYLLAFMGLMRLGCPYSITEAAVADGPETDADASGKRGETQECKSTVRVINLVIDDIGYSCMEDDLKERFGKQYGASEMNKPGQEEENKDSDFVMPYSRFEEDDEKGEEAVISKEENNVDDEGPRIPFIAADEKYPHDKNDIKEYDSFLFNSHNITVMFDDGSRIHFLAAVYPVYMDISDSIAADIFAAIIDDNGRIRCAMSPIDNGQKGVNLEFEECTLVMRGEWRNGNFLTKCSLLSTSDGRRAVLTEKVKRVVPTKRTSTFYLRHIGEDGSILNVFPLTLLRNNPTTGLASAVVMIEDGHSRNVYSGDNGTYFSLWYDNSQKRIDIFWAGNSLNLSIQNDRRA